MKNFKKIGILTSGGDAPGMNAAIRAVVRYALKCGIEVYGIYEGYKGLIGGEGYIKKFTPVDVANIIDKGGTILYSARCPEFKTEEGLKTAAETCRKFGIDGLITIGGDGTFRGASDLCKLGIPCIGIPGSIDNDITATDYSIGFDTAMNTVLDCVDRLRDTCESHARCDVVEVMGNRAGYIALQSGIAVGASAIVVREDSAYDEEEVMEKLRRDRDGGKRNFIVIVSENVPNYSEGLAKRIEEKTGITTKFCRLAHIVRGGSPSLRDRLTASRMGVAAVDMLREGKENLFVCERNGLIEGRSIAEAITIDRMYKTGFIPEMGFKESELDAYSPEKVAEFKEFVEMRRKEVADLLRTVHDVSNYS